MTRYPYAGSVGGDLMLEEVMARIVAEYALFLQFSDDNTLDPKLATSMLEGLAADLEALSPSDRGHFSYLMQRLADSQELSAHAAFLRSL